MQSWRLASASCSLLFFLIRAARICKFIWGFKPGDTGKNHILWSLQLFKSKKWSSLLPSLCGHSATRSGFWPLHVCALCLAFQHPFVSKVTSNRALRELVAEAKAEVMEEIEDSRDEVEEDDSSESASVSTPDPVLASLPVQLWWGKEPSNFSWL